MLARPGPARHSPRAEAPGEGGDRTLTLDTSPRYNPAPRDPRESMMLPSLLLLTVVLAQQPMQDSAYTRTEAMIPMRDGVKLHTVIEAPRNATGPLGILMDRTPYGADGAAAGAAHNAGYLGLSGLIIVAQDIRGRFQSEGTFAMNRPPHSGPQGTDENTDTYHTIDWL